MTQPRLLSGRYELDCIVGRGGMAEIFRARDIRLDRIVAVKTLRIDLARDRTSQARFRREAQSAASLNHPSIVSVYDTGEDIADGISVPYIVMEFVEGQTLRDLLRDERQLLPQRAAEITAGVLTALDYSHRNGIVHRDIKPGNVMLTESGDVKVMDFGIARPASGGQLAITQASQVIGTVHYLSPEQARGEQVDARSDLYSTGCMLHELLTGQPPFTGDSPMAIAYQHVREDPQPPSRVDPEVPAWADAIVLKALQKDPARRYQSAAEMRDAIRQALAGAPATAPKRRAWPLAMLAAVIIALVLATLGIKFLTNSNNGVGVPSVSGMPLMKAEQTISGDGLRVGKVSYTPSVSVAKHDVILTKPSYGTQVPAGSAINLVVSSGHGPAAHHPRSRHSNATNATSSPGISSRATAPPATGPPATGPPSPSPTLPSASPSSTCVVNILGICV